MLSGLWTIFSLGAGALARRTEWKVSFSRDSTSTYMHAKDSGWDMGTSSRFAFPKEPAPTHIRLEHLEDDLLLEKQGLVDDRLHHDLKVRGEYDHSANPSVKYGILSPLVHRRSSSSDRA
ncbi:hypothetical protein B0H14DRAFT_2887361 [Mycena olivaceomarginata]|nr:hypothetical protein B0H14DRAFT_2887361 [Mycena olivaceomarginata]